MKVIIIASVLNLTMPVEYNTIVGSVALVNYSKAIFDGVVPNDFKALLGSYGLTKIHKDCALAFTINEDDIAVSNSNNKDEIYIASEQAKEYINQFGQFIVTLDTFLWFVKDNSSFVVEILCYVDAGNAKAIMPTDYRRIVSNCNGEFITTEYSREEFERALNIRTSFYKACPLFVEADEKYIPKLDNKGRAITDEFVRDLNPIERAFSFLRAARNHKSLAPKFSMYMSLFESLFSLEHSELTHRIGERVSFYIATEPMERLTIYNTIQNAYMIRSKYVHGSATNEELRGKKYRLNLLTKIDEYARIALTKAIMEDSDTFIDGNKLGKFLKEIIFKA